MKRLRRFLYFCAAADAQLVEQGPRVEQIKISCMGIAVLLTSMLASLSGGYAILTVLDAQRNPPEWAFLASFGVGLLWGLFIFNIDRLLIASLDDSEDRGRWITGSRLVLAVLIGLVVARPLELQLFEPEIGEVLLAEMDEYQASVPGRVPAEIVEGRRTALEARRVIESSLAECRVELRSTQTEASRELKGLGVSKRRSGAGSHYKSLKAEVAAQEEQCDGWQARLHAIDRDPESAIVRYDGEVSRLRADGPRFGFLKRNEVLGQLSSERSTVMATVVVLTLLVIVMEIAPLLAKLLGSTHVYKDRLRLQRIAEQADIAAEISSSRVRLDRTEAEARERLRSGRHSEHERDIHDHVLDQSGPKIKGKIEEALESWDLPEPTAEMFMDKLNGFIEHVLGRFGEPGERPWFATPEPNGEPQPVLADSAPGFGARASTTGRQSPGIKRMMVLSAGYTALAVAGYGAYTNWDSQSMVEAGGLMAGLVQVYFGYVQMRMAHPERSLEGEAA